MVVDQGKFTIIGVVFVMYLGFGHVEGYIFAENSYLTKSWVTQKVTFIMPQI